MSKTPISQPIEADDAPRRVPTQARSKERVSRIIDAAAVVFAEQGFESATMEGIAERAGTSIGSIYQFFPNKLSLFDALSRHYHEKLRTFFDVLLTGPLLELPWEDILDHGIDALSLFHEQEAGFRAVWVGLHLTDAMVTEGEAINRDFAKRIEVILAMKLGELPAKERPVVATMMVETLTAVLIVSARRPAEAKALMAQTKVMLKRYLAPYVTPLTPVAHENKPKAKRSGRARPAVRSAR